MHDEPLGLGQELRVDLSLYCDDILEGVVRRLGVRIVLDGFLVLDGLEVLGRLDDLIALE